MCGHTCVHNYYVCVKQCNCNKFSIITFCLDDVVGTKNNICNDIKLCSARLPLLVFTNARLNSVAEQVVWVFVFTGCL